MQIPKSLGRKTRLQKKSPRDKNDELESTSVDSNFCIKFWPLRLWSHPLLRQGLASSTLAHTNTSLPTSRNNAKGLQTLCSWLLLRPQEGNKYGRKWAKGRLWIEYYPETQKGKKVRFVPFQKNLGKDSFPQIALMGVEGVLAKAESGSLHVFNPLHFLKRKQSIHLIVLKMKPTVTAFKVHMSPNWNDDWDDWNWEKMAVSFQKAHSILKIWGLWIGTPSFP